MYFQQHHRLEFSAEKPFASICLARSKMAKFDVYLKLSPHQATVARAVPQTRTSRV